MLLQNHPGETEFPVRPRHRHATAAERARRASPPALTRRALLLVAVAGPFGFLGLGAAIALDAPGPSGGVTGPLLAGLYALFVGLLVAVVILHRVDTTAPRRAQREYLRLAGTAPPTPRQQQLLALDAVGDWSVGGWNSSLAFTPAWPELPEDLRRLHHDGADGLLWSALPMMPLARVRVVLDENYRIASAADAELHVADVLDRGPLSRRFAELLTSEDGERMVARLAALVEESPFQVLDRGHPAGDRPPLLLLAGDVERCVAGLRYAYVAGYLGAEQCWELLERVGRRAFERYDGWDAYWHDVELSVAFRTDRLDAVQSHRDLRRRIAESLWPAATVPWPGPGGGGPGSGGPGSTGTRSGGAGGSGLSAGG